MKNIFIVGATGSIGTQTLDVLRNLKDRYRLIGVSARKHKEKLIDIWREFKPEIILIREKEWVNYLKEKTGAKVYPYTEGIKEVIERKDIDTLFFSSGGIDDIRWIVEAIKRGKEVFISSKESFVGGGELIVKETKKRNKTLIPIDSEHSAIFQLLEGKKREEVERIILTASGGPFFGKSMDELKDVKPEDALRHPTWKMGNKITIDSATMFNKGMEVIEAHLLFDIPFEKIDVVIHRESVIHSMVEMKDGQTFALLSYPDMRYPIQYALTYPERKGNNFKRFKFNRGLTFFEFKEDDFPAFKIIVEAGKRKGIYPLSLMIADEMVVNMFLNRKIRFLDISKLLGKVVEKVKERPLSLDIIEDVKKEVRDIIEREVKSCT